MKRYLVNFLIIAGLLLMAFSMFFPVLSLAESGGATPAEPFDWGQLLTIPGAVAVTLLIVQYCKMPLDKVWKIPTRALVLIISFGVMALAKHGTGGIAPMDWPLLIMNSFIVALSAMGTYELTFAKGVIK